MSPFMEVIEEKITLMAIVFFFTVLGLVMIGAEDAPLVITALGTLLFIVSLIIELAIVCWIFISIKKWRREKEVRKARQKSSTGGF